MNVQGHPFLNSKNHASKGIMRTKMPDESEMITSPYEEVDMKKTAKKAVKKVSKKK